MAVCWQSWRGDWRCARASEPKADGHLGYGYQLVAASWVFGNQNACVVLSLMKVQAWQVWAK